jgi:ABC-type multidrug transport system fused ATPase/permease subunit
MTSSHPFQRLMRYGRRYRRQVWQASICSVCNKFFDLAPPVLIGLAVDVVVQQQDSWLAGLGIASIRGQFLVLTALTIVTWGLESAFQYAYSGCGATWPRPCSAICGWKPTATCKILTWLILRITAQAA